MYYKSTPRLTPKPQRRQAEAGCGIEAVAAFVEFGRAGEYWGCREAGARAGAAAARALAVRASAAPASAALACRAITTEPPRGEP
jgi:hypothetical protein